MPFVAHRALGYSEGELPLELPTRSLQCQGCGLVFSQLRLEAEMGSLYQDYRGEQYTRIREGLEPGYAALNAKLVWNPEIAEARDRILTAFLADVAPPEAVPTLLDYGGDKGQYIPKVYLGCNPEVFDVSGVEPVAGVRVKFPFTTAAYSLVLCQHVLEHVAWPRETMKTLFKDWVGSWLCIVVPLECPDRIREPHEQPIYFHEHINYFTTEALQRLCRDTGFRVLKTEVKPVPSACNPGNDQWIYLLAEKVPT
jgi:hypothetical protein